MELVAQGCLFYPYFGAQKWDRIKGLKLQHSPLLPQSAAVEECRGTQLKFLRIVPQFESFDTNPSKIGLDLK